MKWLTVIMAAGMLLVLLMGALVTKTDSGRGCGDDWPLCNGKFIPAYTIESMIEYSHRAVSGVEGILVLICSVWAWRNMRHRWDVKLFAGSVGFFTVLQAILGAMAVKSPQSSAIMALHFGFSLIAVASAFLLAAVVWKWDGKREQAFMFGLPFKAKGNSGGESRTRAARDRAFAVQTAGTLVYCYMVVYLGAFVRHTESAGGCIGWPLCNGQWIPELSGASGVAFVHRVAAMMLLLLVVWLAWTIRRDYRDWPMLYNAGRWAVALVVLQVLSGGFVVLTLGWDWHLLASLLHSVIISCLFGVLCLIGAVVLQMRLLQNGKK